MTKKKILMAVSVYYTSVFRIGTHHYAKAFSKLGYDVAYISYPISPLNKLVANNDELKERERLNESGGFYDGNIWYYVPKCLFVPNKKPFFSSKFILNNWQNFTYPNLMNKLKEKGFDDVDIFWIESPAYSFLFDNIKYKHSIMRVADYSKGFSFCWNNYHNQEKESANRVDKLIYTAKGLKDKFTEVNDKSKMLYVPNGLDVDAFINADKSMPEEFKNIPEPRIIYVGAISDWFDTDLVYKTAKNLPDYNFVIIGPPQIDLSKLKQLKNVYILGSRSYSSLAGYLTHSQVGIIPFKVNELINNVHPLKLYEYMVCGLPSVSMEWDELKNMNSPALLATNYEDFIQKIVYAVNNFDKKNCLNYALEHSWDNKVKLILDNL